MDTDRLEKLIDAKLATLAKLLALSRRQEELIDGSDLSALMAVLAGKQQLVVQLERVDQELAPFQRQNPDERLWPSAEKRSRCRQQAERCQAMLQEILRSEQQAEHAMHARRSQVGQQLAGLEQAAQAQRAYAAAPAMATGALDLSSEG